MASSAAPVDSEPVPCSSIHSKSLLAAISCWCLGAGATLHTESPITVNCESVNNGPAVIMQWLIQPLMSHGWAKYITVVTSNPAARSASLYISLSLSWRRCMSRSLESLWS